MTPYAAMKKVMSRRTDHQICSTLQRLAKALSVGPVKLVQESYAYEVPDEEQERLEYLDTLAAAEARWAREGRSSAVAAVVGELPGILSRWMKSSNLR